MGRRHDQVAGQDRDDHSRRGRGTSKDCRPDGNRSGVPSCGRGEHRHDRGGLGCLPAVAARGPDGGDGGAPCLRGGESVGYPDGQASGGDEGVAIAGVWELPLPTLPSVGRSRAPSTFSSALVG
jgi:hypothetical protein